MNKLKLFAASSMCSIAIFSAQPAHAGPINKMWGFVEDAAKQVLATMRGEALVPRERELLE
jgi:hypothetical protein